MRAHTPRAWRCPCISRLTCPHCPSPPQVAAWEPTLQKIAGWFDQLQAVDVEGVPPATDAGVGGGGRRADEVDTSLADAEEALAQAPEREGEFVRVPKV